MTGPAPRPTLAMLVAISALQPVALNLLAPATPALARHFSESYGTIQLTLTLFLVSVAVTQLIIGPLSDRFGRRPCVIGGIALFALGSIVGALAPTTEVLLAGRVLEGAGGGTAFALSRAIIRDSAQRDEAASMIASVTMVMVVAPMLAPLAGGQIETLFGWRAIFWALTAAAVAVLVYTLVRLPETAPATGIRTGVGSLFASFPTLLRERGFTVNVLAVTMTTAAFFAFIAAAPYIVVEAMGGSSSDYGRWFVLNAAGYMLGNFGMSRLSVKVGTGRLVRIGLVISTIGMSAGFALALLPGWSPLWLFGPLAVCAVGNGLTIPGGTAQALSARPELAGSAAGLMGAIQLGAGALATVVIARIVPAWPPAMPAMVLAMTVIALVAMPLERSGSTGQR